MGFDELENDLIGDASRQRINLNSRAALVIRARRQSLGNAVDAEMLKVGETSQVAIPSQARETNVPREGIETKRASPTTNASTGRTPR
jgi:hypothetical protein